MVYAIKSTQISRKNIKRYHATPLRGPVPLSTVYVYVQAHRSGFFKPQLLRVYVPMYYHILLQTCNICNILQVIASWGIDRGAFLRITA